MAKDGTNRGGRRVRSGKKPAALADKITAGKAAQRIEFHDFGEDVTEFEPDEFIGWCES